MLQLLSVHKDVLSKVPLDLAYLINSRSDAVTYNHKVSVAYFIWPL